MSSPTATATVIGIAPWITRPQAGVDCAGPGPRGAREAFDELRPGTGRRAEAPLGRRAEWIYSPPVKRDWAVQALRLNTVHVVAWPIKTLHEVRRNLESAAGNFDRFAVGEQKATGSAMGETPTDSRLNRAKG